MNKSQNICPHCRIFNEICLCQEIKKFTLKTRLTLLIHIKEFRRITNTGRFAFYSLDNSQVVLKGDMKTKYQSSQLIPDGYRSILLTPHSPIVLDESFVKSIEMPINLIVPDGTWQQARRLILSEEKLYGIPQVRLPFENRPDLTLRKPPQENFFPTLGAIAQALGIIENNEIREYFENLLDTMTHRLRKRLHRKASGTTFYS